MDKYVKIYCDLVCLYDKAHTYHIRTVKMPCSATLHPTLWGIYNWLEEIVDNFGENIIIKYLNKELPSTMDCYNQSIYTDCDATEDESIVTDLYSDIEEVEQKLKTLNNEADNCLAQLIWPIREKFTGFCADLSREMEDEIE